MASSDDEDVNVLRTAVLASMKARLKQKEKASKTGSPALQQDDIEDDPELAALRTVALLSKNQQKEEKRKAAELAKQQQRAQQQQQHQYYNQFPPTHFNPGFAATAGAGGRPPQGQYYDPSIHGPPPPPPQPPSQPMGFTKGNLFVIQTVDLPDPTPVAEKPSEQPTENKEKELGRFSRFEASDSEEEEEDEEEKAEPAQNESEASSSDQSEAEDNKADHKKSSDADDSDKENESGSSSSSDSESSDSSSGSSSRSSSRSSTSSRSRSPSVTRTKQKAKNKSSDKGQNVTKTPSQESENATERKEKDNLHERNIETNNKSYPRNRKQSRSPVSSKKSNGISHQRESHKDDFHKSQSSPKSQSSKHQKLNSERDKLGADKNDKEFGRNRRDVSKSRDNTLKSRGRYSEERKKSSKTENKSDIPRSKSGENRDNKILTDTTQKSKSVSSKVRQHDKAGSPLRDERNYRSRERKKTSSPESKRSQGKKALPKGYKDERLRNREEYHDRSKPSSHKNDSYRDRNTRRSRDRLGERSRKVSNQKNSDRDNVKRKQTVAKKPRKKSSSKLVHSSDSSLSESSSDESGKSDSESSSDSDSGRNRNKSERNRDDIERERKQRANAERVDRRRRSDDRKHPENDRRMRRRSRDDDPIKKRHNDKSLSPAASFRFGGGSCNTFRKSSPVTRHRKSRSRSRERDRKREYDLSRRARDNRTRDNIVNSLDRRSSRSRDTVTNSLDRLEVKTKAKERTSRNDNVNREKNDVPSITSEKSEKTGDTNMRDREAILKQIERINEKLRLKSKTTTKTDPTEPTKSKTKENISSSKQRKSQANDETEKKTVSISKRDNEKMDEVDVHYDKMEDKRERERSGDEDVSSESDSDTCDTTRSANDSDNEQVSIHSSAKRKLEDISASTKKAVDDEKKESHETENGNGTRGEEEEIPVKRTKVHKESRGPEINITFNEENAKPARPSVHSRLGLPPEQKKKYSTEISDEPKPTNILESVPSLSGRRIIQIDDNHGDLRSVLSRRKKSVPSEDVEDEGQDQVKAPIKERLGNTIANQRSACKRKTTQHRRIGQLGIKSRPVISEPLELSPDETHYDRLTLKTGGGRRVVSVSAQKDSNEMDSDSRAITKRSSVKPVYTEEFEEPSSKSVKSRISRLPSNTLPSPKGHVEPDAVPKKKVKLKRTMDKPKELKPEDKEKESALNERIRQIEEKNRALKERHAKIEEERRRFANAKAKI